MREAVSTWARLRRIARGWLDRCEVLRCRCVLGCRSLFRSDTTGPLNVSTNPFTGSPNLEVGASSSATGRRESTSSDSETRDRLSAGERGNVLLRRTADRRYSLGATGIDTVGRRRVLRLEVRLFMDVIFHRRRSFRDHIAVCRFCRVMLLDRLTRSTGFGRVCSTTASGRASA